MWYSGSIREISRPWLAGRHAGWLPLKPCLYLAAMAIRNLDPCGELSSSPAEIQAMAPPEANPGAAAQPKRFGKRQPHHRHGTRPPEQDYLSTGFQRYEGHGP
jgi:hypothetical protein